MTNLIKPGHSQPVGHLLKSNDLHQDWNRAIEKGNETVTIENLSTDELDELEQLKSGGPAFQVEFFEQHRGHLESMVRLRLDPRLKPRVSSADVVQEVYLDFAAVIDNYLKQPTCPPKVWLRKLTRQVIWRINRKHIGQQCRDLRREQRADHLSDTGVQELVVSLSSSVGKKLDRQQLQKKIRKLISQMPKLDREILSLVHFEEQTIREAALELEVSYEAAKKRHRRALQRLKDAHQSRLQEFLR